MPDGLLHRTIWSVILGNCLEKKKIAGRWLDKQLSFNIYSSITMNTFNQLGQQTIWQSQSLSLENKVVDSCSYVRSSSGNKLCQLGYANLFMCHHHCFWNSHTSPCPHVWTLPVGFSRSPETLLCLWTVVVPKQQNFRSFMMGSWSCDSSWLTRREILCGGSHRRRFCSGQKYG